MSSFAFYKKVVPLSAESHRNLKLDSSQSNFDFVRETTSVLLAGMEFAEAGREYPIVFIRGQDQQMRPAALLGVRKDENLFVDDHGKWDARYIPAFVRRYPFVMADGGKQGELMVCIDEHCKGLNNDHGDLLIDEAGQLQPRMNEVMKFMQEAQQAFARTELITKQIDELSLFTQQGARFDTPTGESYQLNDFHVIDEAKFSQLSDHQLPQLFRSGALGLIYLHLASMGNMRTLVSRLSARTSAAKAAAESSPLH